MSCGKQRKVQKEQISIRKLQISIKIVTKVLTIYPTKQNLLIV